MASSDKNSIDSLKRAVEELTRKTRAIENQLNKNRANPLPYPPGVVSSTSQSETSDRYLVEKIFDLVWKNTVHYLSFFESLDGWNPILDGAVAVPIVSPQAVPFPPGVAIDDGGVYLTTSNLAGSQVSIDKYPLIQGLTTWTNRQFFRSAVGFFDFSSLSYLSPANSVAYLLCSDNSTGLTAAPIKYFGFKIVNGVYFGVVSNNGEAEELITGPLYTIGVDGPADNIPNMEARWYPGKDARVFFFVNYRSYRQSPNASLPSTIIDGSIDGVGRTQHLFWFSFRRMAEAQQVIKTDMFTYTDNGASADTITRASGSFISDGFVDGMRIVVTGTVNNNGAYTIATVAALTLTLIPDDALTNETVNSSLEQPLTGMQTMIISFAEFMQRRNILK